MQKEPDEYCEKLFMIIAMYEKIRFNDLYRKLKKPYKIPMSRPTLVEHLNHLLKDKLIQRTEENKQKVTYQVNWRKIAPAKEAKDSILLQLAAKNEAVFKSKNIPEQTAFTMAMLAIGELYYLKLRIQGIMEPENKLVNHFAYVLMRKLYDSYTEWLLKSAKESKEKSEKILSSIDQDIRYLRQSFFDLPKQNTSNTRPHS